MCHLNPPKFLLFYDISFTKFNQAIFIYKTLSFLFSYFFNSHSDKRTIVCIYFAFSHSLTSILVDIICYFYTMV
ncbi:hypothetical protein D3854_02690 [Streptococcus mutans]|nr:hypothetical protein [Streptococcus mutans]NLQ37232.1 hypothetical protein [Streptococcus mutans]NLQ45690.1 hypothetical protein [Streptococcus mutans]NLQ51152.1 hypothetical protein [Streptococcus mutans]NLQ67946.1 hypothetical protein [Streptococcus mutans]